MFRPKSKIAHNIAVTAILLWASFVSSAWSLEPKKQIHHYVHESWGIEDGLPQSSIFSIIQDRRGYIWFGTQQGLVRFNGADFQVFSSQTHKAFASNWVWTLFEDDSGRIWVGTHSTGIVRIDGDKFESIDSTSGLPNDNVRAIAADKEGNVWVGTLGGGVTIFSNTPRTLTAKDGLPSDDITALEPDGDGGMWVGTSEGDLAHFTDKEFTTYGPEQGLNGTRIVDIHAGRKFGLWIATPEGLYRLVGNKISKFTVEDGLPGDSVRRVFEDSDGNLWIGMDEKGLAKLNNGRIFKYEGDDPLKTQSIGAIFEDREENIWVGTLGAGLHQFRDAAVTVFRKEDGLSNMNVRALLADSDNRLWIGTARGLNLFWNDQFADFELKSVLADEPILSLFQDWSGKIWIGTRDRGLLLVEDDELTPIEGLPNAKDLIVYSIYEDVDGRIWLGTINKGVIVWYKDTVAFTIDKNNGLKSDRVWRICGFEDSVFLGTSEGLYRYRDGKATEVQPSTGSFAPMVLTLAPNLSDQLWLGTHGQGLSVVRGNKIVSLAGPKGIDETTVFEILDDGMGWFWFNGNRGIFRTSREELETFVVGQLDELSYERFGTDDGLLTVEADDGGQYLAQMTEEGRLWFATTQGLAMIDPKKIPKNTLPPPTRIEGIWVDGKKVPIKASGVSLPPRAKQLEVHYAGLSYAAPDQVRHQYRLSGFDTDWIDAGTRRVAYYTNLPPGDYTFEVQSFNKDGIKSEKPAKLSIASPVAFYETLWFQAVALLLGAALLISVVLIGSRLLGRRHTRPSKIKNQNVRQVLENQVDTVRQLAVDISEAASDLSEIHQFLRASAEGLAAEADEADFMAKNTQKDATEATLSAKDLVLASSKGMLMSEQSRQAIEKSVKIMQLVKSQANSISERNVQIVAQLEQVGAITRKVKEISGQSKVLAVNAAIEAAKAGRYGHGFAVVAREVKSMALQSQAATNEIAEFLTAFRASLVDITKMASTETVQTEKGTSDVTHAARLMSELDEVLAEHARYAGGISDVLEYQSNASNQIASTVKRIHDAAIHNHALSLSLQEGSTVLNEASKSLLTEVEIWQPKETKG